MQTKIKNTARLLQTGTATHYQINLLLQNSHTAELRFTDRDTARNQFDLLRGLGVIGGAAIKEIEFKEIG